MLPAKVQTVLQFFHLSTLLNCQSDIIKFENDLDVLPFFICPNLGLGGSLTNIKKTVASIFCLPDI